MNGARGKGRNLAPTNFGKEIYCRTNLPPLHICKETFIPEIVEWLVDDEGKDYFRKREGTVPSWLSRLKDEKVSASLVNYREKAEASCRVPMEQFKINKT